MSWSLLLNIKSAYFDLQYYADTLVKTIILKQVSIRDTNLLIFDEYIFSDTVEVNDCLDDERNFTKKVFCEVVITDASKYGAHLVGKKKIGSLIFKKKHGELGVPTLIVELFLEPNFFETIYENLKLKNKISSFEIWVSGFGFENSNTFLKWNPAEPADIHSEYKTNISGATVIFEIF